MSAELKPVIIIDTGIIKGAGKPKNNCHAYRQIRRAVESKNQRLYLPATMYEELGGDPSKIPSGSEWVDPLIEQGWIDVAPRVSGDSSASFSSPTTRRGKIATRRRPRDTAGEVGREERVGGYGTGRVGRPRAVERTGRSGNHPYDGPARAEGHQSSACGEVARARSNLLPLPTQAEDTVQRPEVLPLVASRATRNAVDHVEL